MKCKKSKFQLQGKISYLNCAYMSPLSNKVEKAGKKAIMGKRKPYSITAEDFFRPGEVARQLFSTIIDNPQPNRCVVIPSVSYGIANVVANLPKKQGKVVVTGEQFPSNIYPWLEEEHFQIQTISRPGGENSGKQWNQNILEAIDNKTSAVTLGHIHWADGTVFDLKAIRERCNDVGAALIVDGTQSIGALPFSVQQIQPDALICAGYKWLMGPYSIGMAYYGEIFDEGTPIEQNWINRLHSENFGGLVKYQEEYQEGAFRYGVGEQSNFILLPMLNTAMKQVINWGPQNIQSYCNDLLRPFLNRIKELGYQVEDQRFRASHLFGIRVTEGVKIQELSEHLKRHKVSVSMRSDVVRVSPHVYNEEKDVRRLINALDSAINH